MRIYFDDFAKLPADWPYPLYKEDPWEPYLFVMHFHTLKRCLANGGAACLERGGAILFVSEARCCGYESAEQARKLEIEHDDRIHFLDAAHSSTHPYAPLRAFLATIEKLAPEKPIPWSDLDGGTTPDPLQKLRSKYADGQPNLH